MAGVFDEDFVGVEFVGVSFEFFEGTDFVVGAIDGVDVGD